MAALIRLSTDEFPVEERSAILHIQSALSNLDHYYEDFRAALALFDAIDRVPFHEGGADAAWMRYQWAHICCRDAGMTIYHFGKTMDGIRGSFRSCPTFCRSAHIAELREACKDLERSFPAYVNLRHAIGHRAELSATPNDVEINAVRGRVEFGDMVFETDQAVVTALNGRSFMQTFEGVIVSFTISAASLSALGELKDRVGRAFRDVQLPPEAGETPQQD